MRRSLILITLFVVFAMTLAACGGGGDSNSDNNEANNASAAEPVAATTAGDPVHGEKLFMANCTACHGADAKGVPSLGKSVHPSDSEFIQMQSDPELIEFIKVGRQPDHPLNTTGVAMPPKGGSPALSDSDIVDIVAYIRTLD